MRQEGALRALRQALSELTSIREFSTAANDLIRAASIEPSLNWRTSWARHRSWLLRWRGNPRKLEELRDQVDTYQRLMHKHNVEGIQQLIEVRDEYRLKLDGIESYDAQVEELEAKINGAREEAQDIAGKRSSRRRKAAPDLCKRIVEQLRLLGMPKASVELSFVQNEELTSSGLERGGVLCSTRTAARI